MQQPERIRKSAAARQQQSSWSKQSPLGPAAAALSSAWCSTPSSRGPLAAALVLLVLGAVYVCFCCALAKMASAQQQRTYTAPLPSAPAAGGELGTSRAPTAPSGAELAIPQHLQHGTAVQHAGLVRQLGRCADKCQGQQRRGLSWEDRCSRRNTPQQQRGRVARKCQQGVVRSATTHTYFCTAAVRNLPASPASDTCLLLSSPFCCCSLHAPQPHKNPTKPYQK